MITVQGYKVKEKIYESANTEVYRVIRETDNLPVILKVLKQAYPPPEKIAWFRREYEVTRNLKLSGVINTYGLVNEQHQWIMVLEDFGGDSLDQLKVAGKYSLTEFLMLAIKIVDILGQIHQQNIIHKDVNPTNIIYNPKTGQLKMIDFGISTVLSREHPTFRNPNMLEGTLSYMSPEQTGRVNRTMDYRTDFYSLGATLYVLLTGQLPFSVTDPLELVHCQTAKQPPLPHELKVEIPQVVSDIVMKLMSKNAEDRYQSAYGLKADLEKCLKEWLEKLKIEPFKLGTQDVSDRFKIPQKLYGREAEIDTLLKAFDRVSQGGSEIMLITGYAGIGKTALIQEIYKPITRKRGYFISGKFDQVQRNIPYSSLIQAFRALIRQIISESEDRIKTWRRKLLAALGPNGDVIIQVVPDLELIVGFQPPVPQLPPAQAQNRFNLVFQNFIRVFMQGDHPLVIFLDDLQWADGASLNLLKLLITAPDSHYLFFIGSYRDNEVNPAHPLMLTLDEIQKAQTVVNRICLLPLKLPQINQFIADTVNCMPEKVFPLAKLILEKTGGNPFFIIEFLKSLYQEGLLVFESQPGIWNCDLNQIKARDMTDNVIELMAGKVQKLNLETQRILKLAACIGIQFDLITLQVVNGKSFKETAADLWEAIEEDLVLPLSDAYKLVDLDVEGVADKLNVEYKFSHDRIHQAVYSLISEEERKNAHLKIGRQLLNNIASVKIEEKIFDVVNQLNIGRELITQEQERDRLAGLNMKAGKKAKNSAAYEPAFNYLRTGMELLGIDAWERKYDLALSLYTEAAEAAYLTGDFKRMENLAETVLNRARNLLDKAKIYEVQIQSLMAQHKMRQALKTALPVLEHFGMRLSEKPGRFKILWALLQTKLALKGKDIKDLIDLPEMKNPHKLALARIMASVSGPAYNVAPELLPLLVLKGINLFLKFGNAALSPFAYSGYGIILCGILGEIEAGYRFGELGMIMLDRLKTDEAKTRTTLVVNDFIRHWKEHVKETLPSLLEGYQSGMETGDLEYGSTCMSIYIYHSLSIGRELSALEKETAAAIEAIASLKQEVPLHRCELFLQVMLNLLGKSSDPCSLIGEAYDEKRSLPLLVEANDKNTICNLVLHKMILCFLFKDYVKAVECVQLIEKRLDGAVGTLVIPTFTFYESLARLAVFSASSNYDKQKILRKVNANQKKMKKWAKYAPMNYLHKWCLVEAERCRVFGRNGEAMKYYGKVISLARENEYLNEEALANELAARFYFGIGVETAGKAYLQEAHYAYLCWGAKAKVKALEKEFPQLLAKAEKVFREETTTTTPSTGTRGEMLDLSAVMKASQAISGEIHLDKLLDQLMKIVIENAGAQLGYLILVGQGKLLIEAEGVVDKEEVEVLQSKPVKEDIMPMSIVNYVARSKESVVLNNAAEEGDFTQDPYIKAKQSRSILCAPLLYQNELRGIVYLENNLTTGAFTAERLQMLQMLSAQAAVSIENANAYKTLESKVEERTQELQNRMKDLREFHDLAVGRELKMMEMEKKIKELEGRLSGKK